MTNRDVDAMRAQNRDALFVRVRQDNRKAIRGRVEKSVRIHAADSGYWELWKRDFAAGRPLNETDESSLSKVCVLTDDFALAFFPEGNALGNTLTIGSFDYLVVGIVLRPTKDALMNDGTSRETGFLPYGALERTTDWSWFGSPRVFELMVRAPSVDRVRETADSIEAYLTRAYGTVDGKCRFKVEAIEGALKAIRTIFAAVTAIVAFIAGISLLVSGIGIMNVMLVAVAERTREIGIRKAIGARRADILTQFLAESLFVCLLGGVAGIALGVLAAHGISAVAKWRYAMPLNAPVVALAVSACVGVFFGITPARNAAALDPVVALTKE
jgi:putative ABC transport system permease protein